MVVKNQTMGAAREEQIKTIYQLYRVMGYTPEHINRSQRKWLGTTNLYDPSAPVGSYVQYLLHKKEFREVLGRDNASISDKKLEEMLAKEERPEVIVLLQKEKDWRRWRRERDAERQCKLVTPIQSIPLGEIDWGI